MQRPRDNRREVAMPGTMPENYRYLDIDAGGCLVRTIPNSGSYEVYRPRTNSWDGYYRYNAIFENSQTITPEKAASMAESLRKLLG